METALAIVAGRISPQIPQYCPEGKRNSFEPTFLIFFCLIDFVGLLGRCFDRNPSQRPTTLDLMSYFDSLQTLD